MKGGQVAVRLCVYVRVGGRCGQYEGCQRLEEESGVREGNRLEGGAVERGSSWH